jgi:hypothetical protein
MSALIDLIATADHLCNSLEKASENEKKFCYDICQELEQMSWETYKMMNALQEIKDKFGE